MGPLGESLLHFFRFELRPDGRLVAKLDKGLITLLEDLDTRLRLLLGLYHLDLLNKLQSLLSLALLLHVLFPELSQFLLEHKLMRLFLHVLLDLLARRLELVHYPFGSLSRLKLLILLPRQLHRQMLRRLVLFVLEGFLHFLLHSLHLLLDLLEVAEEGLLVAHPLLKTPLAQHLPLPQDVFIVILQSPYLLIQQGLQLFLTTEVLAVDELHVLLAGEDLLLVLVLQVLEDLVSAHFVLFLSLLQICFLFRLDISQSLRRLLLILVHVLQRFLSVQHFFTSERHLDGLDLLVDGLLIVLSSRLHLLFEQLFSRLLHLLKVIVQVLVKHASVEVVKDAKFDGTHRLQGISLRFLLLDVQEVNGFAVGARDLGQERKTATICKEDQKNSLRYTVVLFIICAAPD